MCPWFLRLLKSSSSILARALPPQGSVSRGGDVNSNMTDAVSRMKSNTLGLCHQPTQSLQGCSCAQGTFISDDSVA